MATKNHHDNSMKYKPKYFLTHHTYIYISTICNVAKIVCGVSACDLVSRVRLQKVVVAKKNHRKYTVALLQIFWAENKFHHQIGTTVAS